MTQLRPFNRLNYHPFDMTRHFMDTFFNEPIFTRRVQTLDSKVLSEKKNYSIWELENGKHEIRVSFSDDSSYYHKSSVKDTLEDAEKYVEEQVAYHARKVAGPILVKDYRKD